MTRVPLNSRSRGWPAPATNRRRSAKSTAVTRRCGPRAGSARIPPGNLPVERSMKRPALRLEHAAKPRGTDASAQLLSWLRGFGRLYAVGVEGTGSYGAGLARHLAGEGVTVVEIKRADRRQRRMKGKSDPLDAHAAAEAVLSGKVCAIRKLGTGIVDAIRPARQPGQRGQGPHQRLEVYFAQVTAAIDLGLSNVLIEGINTKIRLINARGYGHHSAQTLSSMIYLCLGGLHPKLPTTT